MNLFVVPSWYPSSAEPIAGVFIREQADAIADLCGDVNVIVSTWGHADSHVSLRRPWRAWRPWIWRLRRGRRGITARGRAFEVCEPTITWSARLPGGGMQQLLRANRSNLVRAGEAFGRIDLIHAHVSYPAGHIANVLGSEFGIPYVLTEHMGPFPFPALMTNGRPVDEIANAFVGAAQAIAVSASLADRVASFDLPRPKVIPNLVDETKFFPRAAEGKRFVFLTIGALDEHKGIGDLILALAKWNPPAGQVECRIGGTGPLSGALQALAIRLGVADRVRWLGPVSREAVSALFQDCNAFVLPSRVESFGIVLAEAIASGKPVIATRCGGPESIVWEGNGRLVDVGDVHGLAETLEWMEGNARAFDPFVIREDFEKRFSRRAVVAQLAEVYRAVTGK